MEPKNLSVTKIFGIGLNKTGTTTLGECGKILGLRHTGCDRRLLQAVLLRNDFSQIQRRVQQYDLFEDWPWPLIYKELDCMFPGSKFILTVRKSEYLWLNSLKNHSMKTHPIMHCRKLAYGFNYPHKHEHEYLQFYRNHNERVRQYFSSRSNDFIELCWENGDGFGRLCNFLDLDIPKSPFPHANRGDAPKIDGRWLANKLLSSAGY